MPFKKYFSLLFWDVFVKEGGSTLVKDQKVYSEITYCPDAFHICESVADVNLVAG